MTITANDQYRHSPRISRPRFKQLLSQHANPAVLAERDADEYYDACVAYGVDPLFVLAMFNHESSMGKAGVAVTSKSWGNTRTPNFGATPVSDMPGRTGRFPVWASWLDGCKSTAARLASTDWYYAYEQRTIGQIFNDPVADNPNHKPAMQPVPRRVVNGKVQRIEWAPAGDLNSPTGYLNAMLRFMNEHANINEGTPPVSRKPIIALAAGHHNRDRGGAVGEHERVGPLMGEIARQMRAHGGFDVRVITPDNGMGNFAGGLQDVAREAVKLNADCFLEVHMQGVGSSSPRGCFAIYPDWDGDVDHEVRDTLGPDMAKRVRDATGLPLWGGTGTMSERNTGVGGQGFRLGAFGASASARATMTRLLFEYGTLTNPQDKAIIDGQGFNVNAARATVEALAAFYGVADAPREPDIVPPKPAPDIRYFPETGQSIMLGFRAFWEQFNDDSVSIRVFGYPLTGELPFTTPDGKQGSQQYFERAVFEWHPGTGVLLRRLGAEALEEAA